MERKREFEFHIQRAILLTLVDRELLTRNQFEQCIEQLSSYSKSKDMRKEGK